MNTAERQRIAEMLDSDNPEAWTQACEMLACYDLDLLAVGQILREVGAPSLRAYERRSLADFPSEVAAWSKVRFKYDYLLEFLTYIYVNMADSEVLLPYSRARRDGLRDLHGAIGTLDRLSRTSLMPVTWVDRIYNMKNCLHSAISNYGPIEVVDFLLAVGWAESPGLAAVDWLWSRKQEVG